MANTTEHKLAIHMGFIKAVYAGSYKRAKDLKNKCSELGDVDLNKETQTSQWFLDVKDRAAELMQADVQERMEELKPMRESLP